MLTIAELNAIRARVRQNLSVRGDDNEIRIIIAGGTAAIAAGSRGLMSVALEEVAALGTGNVQISQRELAVDANEQPAVVIAKNGVETMHKRVTPAELRDLIRHIAPTRTADAG